MTTGTTKECRRLSYTFFGHEELFDRDNVSVIRTARDFDFLKNFAPEISHLS